jgi:hypothetical protein
MAKKETADIGETQPNGSAGAASNNGATRRPRAWCVVRIVDYRMQALAQASDDPDNHDLEWCDIGGDTVVSCDRESMFQAARRHQGLLMTANGLPSPGRMARFAERVREMEGVGVGGSQAPDAAP